MLSRILQMRNKRRPLQLNIRLRRQTPQTRKRHRNQRQPRHKIRRRRHKKHQIGRPVRFVTLYIHIIMWWRMMAHGFRNRMYEQRSFRRDACSAPDEFLGVGREVEVPFCEADGGEEDDE